MAYVAHDTCPICGSASVEHNHATGIAPRFGVDLAPGFSVQAGAVAIYSQCRACGVLYQNPRMDDEQIARYYADGIYRATLGMSDERMDADEATRAQVDAEIIRREIGGVEYHIDIGASRGYLLQAVGAIGRIAVEPTPGRVLFRDIRVYETIDNIGCGADIVTMIHCLEHEPYPVDYLRKAAALLVDGGCMVVEVPSWQSKGGPLRLAHLYHWPGLTEFEHTAKAAGLRVVKHITTPHNMFILERSQG